MIKAVACTVAYTEVLGLCLHEQLVTHAAHFKFQSLESNADCLEINLINLFSVDANTRRAFGSMVYEKVSEEETTQVQMSRSSKATVIEEVITRVEETEKEVIEKLFQDGISEFWLPLSRAIEEYTKGGNKAPKIHYDEELKQPLGIRLGASIYIEVEVSGYPAPSINWFHGDKAVEDSAKITIETAEG